MFGGLRNVIGSFRMINSALCGRGGSVHLISLLGDIHHEYLWSNVCTLHAMERHD